MPDQSIPKPHPSFRGTSQVSPGDLESQAAKWAIPNLLIEPLATVALNANRLIDRVTGKAHSADDLPYAGLDESGNLAVQAVVFADTGAVALAEGSLGLNSAGDLILHNGVDDGDELPTASFLRRVAGVEAISAAQNQAGYRVKMAEFKIPASRAAINTNFRVVGRLSVQHGSNTNTPAYKIGFCPVESSAVGLGVGWINGITARNQSIFFFVLDFRFFDNGGGTLVMGPMNTNIGAMIYGDSPTPLFSPQQAPSGDTIDEIATAGQLITLGVYYDAPATVSAPTTAVNFEFTLEDLD